MRFCLIGIFYEASPVMQFLQGVIWRPLEWHIFAAWIPS